MSVFRGAREIATVFGVRGVDENDATAAPGWTLSRSPALARALLHDLLGERVDARGLRVDLQRHGAGAGGFTDIELRAGAEFHVVIEAKAGWILPTVAQLEGYAARVDANASRLSKLVSLTAMDRQFASLPETIGAVGATHRSWGDIVRLASRCKAAAADSTERLWLSQLAKHLELYMQTPNLLSSIVHLVPVGKGEIALGSGYSWMDVTRESPPRYFHPIGGPGRAGYPKTPQNYIGFRYEGKVQAFILWRRSRSWWT